MPQRLRRLRSAFLADGRATTTLAILALALITAFYAWRLTAFLVNDDEGSYLYAAWRISLGELPYRDFLTPQLPGFLLPGGLLMKWVGPQVWPLRALAAAATLVAGVFTWKTARLLFGPAVAAGAAVLFLLQPMSFLFGRIFRSEPFMLAWAGLGVYAFVRAYPSLARRAQAGVGGAGTDEAGRPGWLLLSGLAFGLAILCKLFGVLPLAGRLLWLLLSGRREGRPWRRIVLEGLIVGAVATVVVGGVMAYFATLAPNLQEAVIGHHTMQQSAKTRWGSFVESLWFYYEFVEADQGGLILVGAMAMSLAAWRTRDRRSLLFGYQLATMLGFLVLTRDLFVRHVMVLMPAMAILVCAWAASLRAQPEPGEPRSTAGVATRIFPALLLLTFLLTWLAKDVSEGGRVEVATEKLGDLIRLSTAPDDLVFSDFSELNFYGRRPTTYAAASMSAGAAKSGQISWARVLTELAGRKPALIAEVDTATDPGHLIHMPDYADFAAWRDENYDRLGPFHRDFQAFTIYAAKDKPPAVLGDFAQGPKLLGAEPMAAQARAGDLVEVATAWRGQTVPDAEYVVTVRLVDRAGREWAQSDTSLFADDPDDDRKSFAWEPDELIGQRVPLRLPGDLPPGPYRVEVGSYIRDAEAMMLLDDNGQPYPGRAFAGEIEVAPGEGLEIPEGAAVVERYDGETVELSGGTRLTLLGRGPIPEASIGIGFDSELTLWWRLEGNGPSDAHRQRLVVFEGEDPDPRSGQAFAPRAPGGTATDRWPTMVFRQQARIFKSGESGLPVPLMLHVSDGGRTVWSKELGKFETVRPMSPPLAGGGPSPTPWPTLAADSRVMEFAGSGVDAARPDRPHFGDHADVSQVTVWHTTALAGGRTQVSVRLDTLLPSPVAYWSTVQLLDAASRPVAQSDGPLGGSESSMTHWVSRDSMLVEHDLAIPTDLEAGDYILVMAIYNPQSGWRVPVSGPGAQGDMLNLGSVTIRPAGGSAQATPTPGP